MEKYHIRGIQQVGIGVSDLEVAWKWYRENFGADIKVFDDDETANFMLRYTGGVKQRRRAILAINLMGGGGFEVWNYKGRKPLAPEFEIQLGDYGVFATKIKSPNIAKAHKAFLQKGEKVSEIVKDCSGTPYFWIQDPFGNYFQIIESTEFFMKGKANTGLVCGVVIGVPDIEKARVVYQDILGYDVEISKTEAAVSSDFAFVPGGKDSFKRLVLGHSKQRKGGFAELFGSSFIELVEVTNRAPKKMFENRFWGDLGFIQVCYDMQGMDALRNYCKSKGYEFTIDSFEALKGNSFDMGDSAGLFSYIEDDGGTLIEFVEAHKLPLIKGFALDLKNRKPEKSIPSWLIKLLRFKRYKN